MPSPFPGMDPFLEDPVGWLDVHNSFITELRNYLAPKVAPHFFVRVEERVYVTSVFEDIGRIKLVPDVFLVKSPLPQGVVSAPDLTISPAVEIEELLDDEVHDLYLEVVDAKSRQVVTAIEVLSPANKVRGGRGYETMRSKQRTLLMSGANVMEIDLLRAGERLPSLVNRSDYVISMLKPGGTTRTAWFFDLRDTMPVVRLPLSDAYEDVALPLQPIFGTMYDRALYAVSRDYIPPVPPPLLNPADAAWVERTLQAWRDAQRPG